MLKQIFKQIFLDDWVIIVAIIINSIVLFLMGFEELQYSMVMGIIDDFFTIFFICEILVKVRMTGWRFYISKSWNKFDLILVMISVPSLFEVFLEVPDVSYLLVFRLLRVLRILRFMRFIPNIKQMLEGIQRAFRASIFILTVLFIYNVLLAILSSYLFREEAPEHFGNPLISMFSIFQIFTLEGWNEIPMQIIRNAEPGSWKFMFTRFFFFFVVLTGGIFGFSIMNAIFVDEMVIDNHRGLEDKVDKLNEKVDKLLSKRD
ncbi:MAG: ion transporter [Cyclobacteriaceae bacterium]